MSGALMPAYVQTTLTTGILISENMSTGIRSAAPTPNRQTRTNAEAIVYGRRKAKSTIDMVIEVYAQPPQKVAPYQLENNGVIAFSVSRKPTRVVGVLTRMSTIL